MCVRGTLPLNQATMAEEQAGFHVLRSIFNKYTTQAMAPRRTPNVNLRVYCTPNNELRCL